MSEEKIEVEISEEVYKLIEMLKEKNETHEKYIERAIGEYIKNNKDWLVD